MYIIKRSLKLIIAILLFIALAMPIGAALDSGLSHDDPLKESYVDFIPGYVTIAFRLDMNANPYAIPANGISTSTIKAQLKDKHGNDVSVKDVIINFRTKSTGTLSANSAVTNNYGSATVTLTSSTKPEIETIKASSDSVLIPGKTEVEFKDVALDIYEISLSAAPDKIPADSKSTSTITAQLKDKDGNDVSVKDVIINFETTEGNLKTGRAITDYHGRASVTLKSSAKPITAVIEATSDDVLKPGNVEVEFKIVASPYKWNSADFSGFGFDFGGK